MTDKWQLYSQTGIDGTEYGVRIRPGYVVVGFQKEDAQAIVAWQNASIQPEGDILEKAKAVAEKCAWKDESVDHVFWAFKAAEILPEAIAEVERLRSLNESLMENGNDLRTRCQKAEARIKKLEAELENLNGMGTVGYMLGYKKGGDGNKVLIDYIKRLKAAFLKAEKANLMHHMDADYADENAREALERIKEGGKDE